MGKALLEQFKSMEKTIVIDNPLDNVIGFYTKCGFTAVDPFRMIYTPPKQVDKGEQEYEYQRFCQFLQKLRKQQDSMNQKENQGLSVVVKKSKKK